MLGNAQNLLITTVHFRHMDTRKIILEQITWKQYQEAEKIWGDGRRARNHSIYSHIHNPVCDTDYERLFISFVNLPFEMELSVRERNKWHRANPAGLTRNDSLYLAKIAAADAYKRNYVTLTLGIKENNNDRIIVEFAERNGLIIGYKMIVPYALKHLVTSKEQSQKRYVFNHGICMPQIPDKIEAQTPGYAEKRL